MGKGKAKETTKSGRSGSKKAAASVDQAKAVVGVAKGKAEKTAGKLSDNKKLQAKGKADETGAKGYGKVAKTRKKLAK